MARLGGACLLARAKLAKYVADLRQPEAGAKVSAFSRAMMLSNPASLVKDVAENTAMLGLEHLSTRPIAVGMDYLTALGQSLFTGRPASEFRSLARIPAIKGVKHAAEGMSEGWQMAKRYVKTGVDERRIADKVDYQETTFKNKINNAIVQTIFRLRGVPDYPFSEAAYKVSLYGQARLRAIREGLKGADLEQRADEILKTDVTPEMQANAFADGEKASYRQGTVLGDFLGGVKQQAGQLERHATTRAGKIGAGALRVGVDLTIPFTRTVSAALSTGVEYSPLGFIKALAADTRPEVMEQLGRATTGSAILALAYQKARNGELTGPFPSSASERAAWEREGKIPFGIKIGDRWVDYTRGIGPALLPMVMGVAAATTDDESGLAEQSTRAVLGATRAIADQTGGENIGRTIDALTSDDPKKVARVAQGYIPVPSIVGQVASGLDPVARETRDAPFGSIRSRIPGLSTDLPARLTDLGDTVRRREEVLSSALARNRAIPDDPVIEELSRLNVNVPAFGAQGRTIQDRNAMKSEFGPIKRAVVQYLMHTPDYQAADDALRAKMLTRALRRVQSIGTRTDKARRAGVAVPHRTAADLGLGAQP